MGENPTTAMRLSIAAIAVSLASALFSGLQWNEARQARLDQQAAARRN